MFISNLNTFVHMIMYTYYMLAAVGPHMQKYLWWKKYLTVIQLVRIIIIIVHADNNGELRRYYRTVFFARFHFT